MQQKWSTFSEFFFINFLFVIIWNPWTFIESHFVHKELATYTAAVDKSSGTYKKKAFFEAIFQIKDRARLSPVSFLQLQNSVNPWLPDMFFENSCFLL